MDFPNPWYIITSEEAAGLHDVFILECAEGHILFGVTAKAIAKSGAADDVLFLLNDGRAAIVHLVWAGRKQKPPWPRTKIYDSLDSVLKALNEEYKDWD